MDQFAQALTMLVTTSVVPAAIGGLIWGMLGGSMPGLSASITMALLLPFTYTLEPMPAIVMLATCYIGAEYGGWSPPPPVIAGGIGGGRPPPFSFARQAPMPPLRRSWTAMR